MRVRRAFCCLSFMGLSVHVEPARASYNDDAIRSEISRIDAATHSIQNQTEDVHKQTSRVESDITRVGNDTVTARSQKDHVERKINEAHNDISRLNIELQQYTQDRRDFEFRHREFEEKKDQIKNELTAVLSEIFNLQKQIEVKEADKEALNLLQGAFLQFLSRLRELSLRVSTLTDASERLQEKHQKWLSDFAALVNASSPDLFAIHGLDTFREQCARVLHFVTEVPSDQEASRLEEDFRGKVGGEILLVDALQGHVRTTASLKGIAVIRGKTGERKILDSFERLDKWMEALVRELNRFISFIEVKRERRSYLKEAVPAMWFQQLSVRLHEANVENAEEIIALEYTHAHWLLVYKEVKDWLLDQESIYKRYNQNYCPQLGIQVTEGALQKLDDLFRLFEEESDKHPAQQALLSELKADLMESRGDFLHYLMDAKANLKRDDEFSKERRRIVRRALDRHGEAILSNNTCLDATFSLLGGSTGIDAEMTYIEFQERC